MINEIRVEPAIELINVTKRFGAQTAVDEITLSIPAGTVFGLIGPNGAGKSTTIRMIMGLTRPDAGCVRVLGMDAGRDTHRIKRRIGYVPELHYMYRWMRLGEALRFSAAFYPTWDRRLCETLMDQFSLDARKRIKQLSKGMLAKFALVLALAHRPELLILDEPTSGLDLFAREDFLDGVLRTMCDGSRTVLFSSHTIADVQRLADSVGIINHGRLLVHRPVDELLSTTKTVHAVLADGCLPQSAPLGAIWERVQRREWSVTLTDFTPAKLDQLREQNAVEGVEVADLGLEDVFKAFVLGSTGRC